MNKVILNWHAEGIFTVENAKNTAVQKSAPKTGKSNATPSKFVNFEQPEYDFDAFERKSIGGSGNK